jgi:hypothetical protein
MNSKYIVANLKANNKDETQKTYQKEFHHPILTVFYFISRKHLFLTEDNSASGSSGYDILILLFISVFRLT